MLSNHQIDIDPEYQRGEWPFVLCPARVNTQLTPLSSPIGVVWNDTKQSALIDSLITNHWMPPIVFCEPFQYHSSPSQITSETAVTDRTDTTAWKMTCIDGKQRLTSIRRYVASEHLLKYADYHPLFLNVT